MGQHARRMSRVPSPSTRPVDRRAVLLVFVAGLALLMPVSYRAGADHAHPHSVFQLWLDAAHDHATHDHDDAADHDHAADPAPDTAQPLASRLALHPTGILDALGALLILVAGRGRRARPVAWACPDGLALPPEPPPPQRGARPAR